jgi:hypothetical protein
MFFDAAQSSAAVYKIYVQWSLTEPRVGTSLSRGLAGWNSYGSPARNMTFGLHLSANGTRPAASSIFRAGETACFC